MKVILAIIKTMMLLVLLVPVQWANAQDVGYTQYYANLPTLNPGFTGFEGFWDTKFAYRQGWRNFSDENNQVLVSSYGALKDGSALRTNSLRISDPSRLQKLASSKEVRRKHGLGGLISNYKIGPFKSTEINANYSYHIPITENLTWSVGSKVSIDLQRLDLNGYQVRDEINDAFYQQLINGSTGRQSFYGIDLGSVLYSNDFYLGLSTTRLIRQRLGGDEMLEISNVAEISMQAGGFYRISAQTEISPGIIIDYNRAGGANVRISARARIREMFYAGLAIQPKTKVSGLFGITVDSKLNVHYAYDHYTSDLSNFRVNVHEVMIGVSMFNKYSNESKMW